MAKKLLHERAEMSRAVKSVSEPPRVHRVQVRGPHMETIDQRLLVCMCFPPNPERQRLIRADRLSERFAVYRRETWLPAGPASCRRRPLRTANTHLKELLFSPLCDGNTRKLSKQTADTFRLIVSDVQFLHRRMFLQMLQFYLHYSSFNLFKGFPAHTMMRSKVKQL